MSENGQTLERPPVVNAAMLIRRPVAEVFKAIVDPEITSKFWFTKGSGSLEPGASVRWDWEMYGVWARGAVREFEEGRRILMEWSSDDTPTTVEWRFRPLTVDTTFVEVTNEGFAGSGDERVRQALDSMGGFTMVLAGLKAFLEHGIQLNLVADRLPAALRER
jgi:uncharacterized protein YndB with AHSA1/START domain